MTWRFFLLGLLLAGPGSSARAEEPTGPLYFDWFRDNYIISSYDENGRNGVFDQAKFQISVRTKVAKWHGNSLVLAYTQKSMWDIAGRSSPFESTDFNPELYVELGTGVPMVPFVRVGFEHESNGLPEDRETRSWDRVYLSSRFAMGTQTGTSYTRLAGEPAGFGFFLEAKAWGFNAKREEEDLFEEYAGYFEVEGDLRFRGEGRVFGLWKELFRSAGVRARLRGLPLEEGDRGFLEVGAHVSLTTTVQAYVQYFRGYGEQLVDIDADGWEDEAIKAGLRFGQ